MHSDRLAAFVTLLARAKTSGRDVKSCRSSAARVIACSLLIRPCYEEIYWGFEAVTFGIMTSSYSNGPSTLIGGNIQIHK